MDIILISLEPYDQNLNEIIISPGLVFSKFFTIVLNFSCILFYPYQTYPVIMLTPDATQ